MTYAQTLIMIVEPFQNGWINNPKIFIICGYFIFNSVQAYLSPLSDALEPDRRKMTSSVRFHHLVNISIDFQVTCS